MTESCGCCWLEDPAPGLTSFGEYIRDRHTLKTLQYLKPRNELLLFMIRTTGIQYNKTYPLITTLYSPYTAHLKYILILRYKRKQTSLLVKKKKKKKFLLIILNI